MARTVKLITIMAWGLFALANATLLLSARVLPFWLSLLLWVLSLMALGWLMIRYNRALAQWRAVFLTWLVCCALWLLGMQLRPAAASSVQASLILLIMLLFLDALIASLFAIVALAIRRDVSVAYVVIFYALGAPLLRNGVNAAGGVLNFFRLLTSGDLFERFSFVKLSLPALSCMVTFGFLTFLPHLIWLGIKELRGR